MKKIFFFTVFILLLCSKSFAGTIRGAWEMVPENSTSNERAVMLASLKYLSIAVFEKNTYIRTYGGSFDFSEDGKAIILTIEFNDKHPETVGTKITYKFERKEDEFSIENQRKTIWKRIDKNDNALSDIWRIVGREGQDGKMTEMKRGARKTLKICTGTRFQWFAINPETKEFFGTGGGTYTLIDGKYTEKWQHTGKSSKGDKVNEIWEKEN